jgi:hypothetical protein
MVSGANMSRVIETVSGKTISQLTVLGVEDGVELEFRFTDGTCLHLDARSRIEILRREYDSDGEMTAEYPLLAQESR